MRIIEPGGKKQTKKPRRWFLVVMLLSFIGLGVVIVPKIINQNKNNAVEESTQNNVITPGEQQETTEDTIPGTMRKFSGNEFRLLFDNLLQPNLNRVDIPPAITGNDIADARIRQIAETRGYKLRSSPSDIGNLVSVDGYALQGPLKQSWQGLKTAAANAGHPMTIVSGYRSVEDQRELFLARLQAEGVNVDDVANGLADDEINKVLVTTSIPGYSKHHTAYTIDILCVGYVFEQFGESPCHDWLIENNYEKAKEFGFIPSYPADADLQGPDPEAWEYVWVGTGILFN